MERYPHLSTEYRRALRMLADAPHDCTIAMMLAHGFTNAMLDMLVRDGEPAGPEPAHARSPGSGCPAVFSRVARLAFGAW